MKSWHFFLAGLAIGICMTWCFTGHRVGRYKVEQIPGALLRTDTMTGKTWISESSSAAWKEVCD